MIAMLRPLLALAAACLAQTASAHMMEAGHGSVRLVGDSAYAVIALPVAAFEGVDDNGDGLLDRTEVDAHRAVLSAQVSAMLALESGAEGGSVVFEDLLLSHADQAGVAGEATLIVMRRYRWAQPISSLRMRVAIFGKPATAGTQLTMRAIEGLRIETATFTAAARAHSFFAGPGGAPPASP